MRMAETTYIWKKNIVDQLWVSLVCVASLTRLTVFFCRWYPKTNLTLRWRGSNDLDERCTLDTRFIDRLCW